MSLTYLKLANPVKYIASTLVESKYVPGVLQTSIISHPFIHEHIVYELTTNDEKLRRQYAQIIGKIGIRKWDAGILWTHYKNKRIKIKKRRKVI